jgi:KDO2-lipid IV(A) lauroyltransferase
VSQKRRSKAVDYSVYLAVRVLVCVLQGLPRNLAYAFGHTLALLAYRMNKRHRLVAADNLRQAFPEKSDREIDGLVHGCYRHFCTMLVEIVQLPRTMTIENYRDRAVLVNMDAGIRGLIGRERPMMLVLGHFGNWELAGYALGAFGFKTFAIARVLDNPYLERFLKQFRQKTGQTIIAKNDDFERLQNALRSGATVATLADQDAGPRGVFVEFFGRQASAHKAVALMAMEFDALMIVTGTPRVGNRYELIAEDVIDPRTYANRGDAVKAITQRYHAALERLIRRNPEQYFWLHRRWKSRPAEKKAKVPLANAA